MGMIPGYGHLLMESRYSGSSYRRSRLRSRTVMACILILILLGYGASPYIALYRLKGAFERGDTEELMKRIDIPAIRASLEKQLAAPAREAAFESPDAAPGSFVAAIEPLVFSGIAKSLSTAGGVATLVTGGVALQGAAAGKKADPVKLEGISPRKVFFSSPIGFFADFDRVKLRFRLRGLTWRLREMELKVFTAPENPASAPATATLATKAPSAPVPAAAPVSVIEPPKSAFDRHLERAVDKTLPFQERSEELSSAYTQLNDERQIASGDPVATRSYLTRKAHYDTVLEQLREEAKGETAPAAVPEVAPETAKDAATEPAP